MSFSSIQITAKGRALLAKAQTGTQINFTHIKMGDGSMTGQVTDEMTDVINQKVNLSINSLKVLTGGKAKVSASFSNQGLSTGFYWRELAVFATDPDNSQNEIMYCYGNAGALADYIPAEGSQILEKVVSIITLISNASNVTAVIDQSLVYATVQDLNDKISHSLATAAGDFLIASKAGQFVKKTVSEVKALLSLGTAAYKNIDVAEGVASFNMVDIHLKDNFTHGLTGTTDVTGTSTGYTLTPSIPLLEYKVGQRVTLFFDKTNSGAITLNISKLGAVSLKKHNGLDYEAGEIKVNTPYNFIYNGICLINSEVDSESRIIQEYDANSTRLSGAKKDDLLCWSGKCVYALTSSSTTMVLTEIIIDKLRFFKYALLLRIKSANNSLTTDAIKVEVQKNVSGSFVAFSTSVFKASDFSSTTDYNVFPVYFNYTGPKATNNQIKIVITLLTQTTSYEIDLDSIVIMPVGLGVYLS